MDKWQTIAYQEGGRGEWGGGGGREKERQLGFNARSVISVARD